MNRFARVMLACALALGPSCGVDPIEPEPAAYVQGDVIVKVTDVIAVDSLTVRVIGDVAAPNALFMVTWVAGIQGSGRVPLSAGSRTAHFDIPIGPYTRFGNAGIHIEAVDAASQIKRLDHVFFVGPALPRLAAPAVPPVVRTPVLPLVLSVEGRAAITRIDVVIDSGTSTELRFSGGKIREENPGDWTTMTVDLLLPLPLVNGTHAITFTAVDARGARTLPVTRSFTQVIAERPYDVTPIDDAGARETFAADISETNVVAGWLVDQSGRRHAATWQAGRWTRLTAPDTIDSQANAINSLGDAVGAVGPTATLWRSGSSAVSVSVGNCCATFVDINEAGTVVGTSSLPSGYVYTYDGALSLTYCAERSRPAAIDDRGVVIGAFVGPDREGQMYCHGQPTITYPGDLLTPLNRFGPIRFVGQSDYVGLSYGQWFASIDGSPQPTAIFLEPLLGAGVPQALSRSRQLVARDSVNGSIWFLDLPSRVVSRMRLPGGWSIDSVTAMTANGVITARATNAGTRHAVLLTPR